MGRERLHRDISAPMQFCLLACTLRERPRSKFGWWCAAACVFGGAVLTAFELKGCWVVFDTQAFYLARTGRPGPVLIDVPKDIQQQLAVPDWDVPMAISGYMARLPQQPSPLVCPSLLGMPFAAYQSRTIR